MDIYTIKLPLVKLNVINIFINQSYSRSCPLNDLSVLQEYLVVDHCCSALLRGQTLDYLYTLKIHLLYLCMP